MDDFSTIDSLTITLDQQNDDFFSEYDSFSPVVSETDQQDIEDFFSE